MLRRLPCIFCIVLTCAAACTIKEPQPKSKHEQTACNRIVSLAPSLTEIAFALGLGNRVVGVTHFCDYPLEARTKQEVGGYATPNYELLTSLRPDAVLLLEHHAAVRAHLQALGLNTLMLKSEGLQDVLNSIRSVSVHCGVAATGASLVTAIEKKIRNIEKKTAHLDRPRILMTTGRRMGSAALTDIFVVGKRSFFNDVIVAAGGENAMPESAIQYSRISTEGIIALNPEVIVDLMADLDETGISVQDVIEQWQEVGRVDAVASGRVHVIGEDFAVIPGPRIVLLIEALAKVFHPEVDWS
ncbi:MAG: helical backbone metal receptor [Myxococcota bacterium]|nr:helical backbone metal receptor [Myxococcota bacterium]